MHCPKENTVGKSTDPNSPLYELRAGGRMEIRRNTFCFTRNVEGKGAQAIVIRGYPKDKAVIEANRFMHNLRESESCENIRNAGHKEVPYRQANVNGGWPNMEFRNNQYGHTTRYRQDIGAPINLVNLSTM